MFDLLKQYHEDFELGNWYTYIYPSSNFRHTLMLSLKGKDRTYNLDNNILTTYFLDGRKEKETITDIERLKSTIIQLFKINLNSLKGLDDRFNIMLKSL